MRNILVHLGLPSCVELYESRAAADGRFRVYQCPTFDDFSILQRQEIHADSLVPFEE